ncbi:copper resistance protein B [Lysobacter enzymogenes]|uniref:Copper resistance protein B n=1 Tax=Lysobacter enzymogenes TaxID=69 RepID=A0A3N2RF27_LYSEN|nr:copper resistance protein B [Lysobacter enzymogenes]ROU06052.1 copper resistance protein B [Lysobacter enzymogenes]
MKTTALLPRSALALALSFAGVAGAQQHDHAGHAAETQPAAAMDHAAVDHSQMDHSQHGPAKKKTPSKQGAAAAKPAVADASQTDRSQMDHSAHAPAAATPPPDAVVDHSKMDHSNMDHSKMDHSQTDQGAAPRAGAPQRPREPIPAVTDADRAAAFPPISLHMQHAPEFGRMVVFNRLEAVDAEHGSAQAWEGQAWFGNDTDRLWLRSEGEREDGRTESANLEALYGRAISPWWDVVAGVRHDFRPERSQTWAAFGLQGLSPYKFEVSATAYLGERGRTALNLEAEYELLLTNRLILQPLVEVEFYGKDDPRRETGAGLSTAEAGLRLRYEFSRKFAPYIGVSWERAFGDTADYRRAHGERIEDTRLVAGVRLWF